MLVFFKKKLDNFAFEADKYINKLLVDKHLCELMQR